MPACTPDQFSLGTDGGKELITLLSKQLCGSKGKTIQADMTLLATNPVYRPGKPA